MSDWRHTFRALRHRDFRLYVFGQVVSLTGTWMQGLALSWLIYRLTKSTLLMGTVGFASQIPVLLLSPLAGLAADRFSRRRITIGAQVLMLAQALTLAALTLNHQITVAHVLLLATAMGILNAFEIPARQSLYIHMVGKEDLPNAIALNSMTFNAARVVGPSMGGFIVAAAGEGVCFAINAASYLAVLASFFLMRMPEPERMHRDSPLTHLREGFQYVWTHRSVRSLLGLTALMNFACAPASVLAPVFADALFHKGSTGLGFLSGTFGLGAVAGTLVLARHGRTAGLARIILVSAFGVGAGLALYSGAPVYAVSVVAIGIIGFSIMRQLAGTNTAIQSMISDDFRGRVMALYSSTVVGVTPIGNLAAGAAAEHIGPRWTMLAGALLACAGAAAFARTRSEVQTALDHPAGKAA